MAVNEKVKKAKAPAKVKKVAGKKSSKKKSTKGIVKPVVKTKAILAQEVAQAAELSNKEAEIIITEILQVMIEGLREGDEIELRGFGSFRQRERQARKGRNPKTGDGVAIPRKRVVYFRMGKELKAFLVND